MSDEGISVLLMPRHEPPPGASLREGFGAAPEEGRTRLSGASHAFFVYVRGCGCASRRVGRLYIGGKQKKENTTRKKAVEKIQQKKKETLK